MLLSKIASIEWTTTQVGLRMDHLLEQIFPAFFWKGKSFLVLHSILRSTFAKRIQKKRSGPLSFIPAVLKAQFPLLRLLRSMLHKKEWTACYSTKAGISNTNHYTVIYLKNVDFTWRWYLLKPAKNLLSV